MKNRLLLGVGAVLAFASGALTFFVPAWIAATVGALFLQPTVPILLKTQKGQMWLLLLLAAAPAYAIWLTPGTALLWVAMPFIAVLGMHIRLELYLQIARSKALWLEPALWLGNVALLGLGFVQGVEGWQAVVAPGLVVLIHTGVALGTIQDLRKQTLQGAKGYAVEIGEPVPDFELKDENGNLVRLSSFRNQQHVLIIFYRGDWCPYCNIMLRTYARESARFAAKNIVLLAVGPDDINTNRHLVENMKVDFKILSDPKLEVVNQYGIRVKNHNPKMAKPKEADSPLPASFLVDKNGVLRFTSHPKRVGEFLQPDLIFPVLENL